MSSLKLIASSLRWLEEDHDHDHDLDPDHNEFDFYNMTETAHHEDHVDKPWGEVIGASLVVQLATFSGLLLSAYIVFHRRFFQSSKLESSALLKQLTLQVIPAFAGGAVLATAVFLIIPESFMLLQESSQESHEVEEEALHAHDDESDHDHLRYLEGEEGHEEHAHGDESYFWKFGSAILAGFLFPVLLGAIFPPADVSECEECKRQEQLRLERIRREQRDVTLDLNCEQGNCCHQEHMDESDDALVVIDEVLADEPHFANLVKEAQAVHREETNANKEADTSSVLATDGEKVKHSRNIPLASSILIGDAFHNFTDGIFLGNAFLLCDRTVAYTIVATTVYHELAQEVADYGLLVHHCGLKPTVALALNFLSSFSLMLGSLLILSLDMSDISTGIILAISAGVYIYLGASECVPRAHGARKKPLDTFYFFLCFLLGAVPIGLVLLNHEHCEAEGHDH